jgi:RNA polymerase sigma factor (sigma-70 family)
VTGLVLNINDYRHLTFSSALERLPDPDADVHEAALLNLETARLHRELNRLSEPDRHVIAWRYGIGCQPLSLRQIAKRLGIALGSAWNIEQRALNQLRDAYADARVA